MDNDFNDWISCTECPWTYNKARYSSCPICNEDFKFNKEASPLIEELNALHSEHHKKKEMLKHEFSDTFKHLMVKDNEDLNG
jgi:hypothetical protein